LNGPGFAGPSLLKFPARLKAEELLRRAGNEDVRSEKCPAKKRSFSTFHVYCSRESGKRSNSNTVSRQNEKKMMAAATVF